MTRECFGLYRAVVRNNTDPLGLGRLKVAAPDLCGPTITGWVEPCIAVGTTVLPEIGDMIWIMCEKGDPDYLVWMGVLKYTATPHEAFGTTIISGTSESTSTDKGSMT